MSELRSITKLKINPENPRIIKDYKFQKLVQSIREFPEMLDTRQIVVNKNMVILGGNMRFRAAIEAGLKEVPVTIVDWSEEKQKEFIIKDNVSGGEWDWDILSNDWNEEELQAWGVDLPMDFSNKNEELNLDDFSEIIALNFNLKPREFDFVMDALNKIDSNKEMALLKALRYEV